MHFKLTCIMLNYIELKNSDTIVKRKKRLKKNHASHGVLSDKVKYGPDS